MRARNVSVLIAILAGVIPFRADAQLRSPEEVRARERRAQTVIGENFFTLSANFRELLNWESVSGDHPLVVAHSAKTRQYGVGFQGGVQMAEPGGRPLWGIMAGHIETGAGTTTLLDDETLVKGDVLNYGAGAGVRLGLGSISRLMSFIWLMGYVDRNEGKFSACDCKDCALDALEDLEDCEPASFSEDRNHPTSRGDFGVGLFYRIRGLVGLELGAGYSGMLNSRNADEGVRVYVGLNWSSRREVFY